MGSITTNGCYKADRPSLLELADSVSNLTQQIVSHLMETKHETPDFTSTSAEIPLTPEYESLRIDLNTAARDLLRLVNGPKVDFRSFFTKHYEMAAWQVALEFDYFGLVPLSGSISVKELAARAGMDEDRTMHVMRFLATQRVFKELVGNSDGNIYFEHSAGSIVIAREPLLKDTFLMQADEMFRAASSTSDSIRKSPFKITAESCPFAMRHGDRAYSWYEQHPAQAARFARAMAGVTLRKSSPMLFSYARCAKVYWQLIAAPRSFTMSSTGSLSLLAQLSTLAAAAAMCRCL
jgi:hypothetical protein